MQTENLEGQESIFDRDSGSGKMYLMHFNT